ncbi:MAG: thioredoxin reductase, partial [Fusobacteriia bacterium 4572_132]
EFLGRGVSYCATCDGAFFKNLDLSVFGQGEEAVEEALFLTKHAKKVYFFVKDDKLKCDKELYDMITQNEKVEIIYNRELKEIAGDQFVEKVIVEDVESKKEEKYEVAASFLYLGTKSNSQLFSMFAKLDAEGYIETNEKMETMMPGIYAAGDIRKKVLRQVVTAAADGAIAGTEAIKYIMKLKKEK